MPPEYAQEWLRQWQSAAPQLRRIREEELRKLNDVESPSADKPVARKKLTHADALRNGLAIQQAWFMRQRILDIERSGNKR
jgi:hypothetical protein